VVPPFPFVAEMSVPAFVRPMTFEVSVGCRSRSTPPETTVGRDILESCLERQLEAVAERDGNPLSATIRRLVSLGLRAEQQAEDR